MKIWVVVSISCPDCNRISVATFKHKPTKEDISSVVDICGGMFCINSYSIETSINGEPILIDCCVN